MTTRTKLMWPLLLAAGLMFTNVSCKKSANDMNAAIENNSGDVVSVTGRTADAKPVNVQMSRALLQQAKAGQRIQLQQNTNGSFTGLQVAAATTARPGPLNCGPVPQSTLDHYQKQANDCCCSFAVCLMGENCDFYFYYFAPNNGCTGGGNEM